MKTKRKFRREIVSKTRTLALLAGTKNIEIRFCELCDEKTPMLEPDLIRRAFQIGGREIFRLIEDRQVHYLETDSKKVFVCLLTLGEALGGETRFLIEARNER